LGVFKYVKALVEQAGGVYLQGEDRFVDALHLNEVGSQEFSRHLAEVIAPQLKSK
jgi:lysophospholipase L1-like esterase